MALDCIILTLYFANNVCHKKTGRHLHKIILWKFCTVLLPVRNTTIFMYPRAKEPVRTRSLKTQLFYLDLSNSEFVTLRFPPFCECYRSGKELFNKQELADSLLITSYITN